MPNIASVLKSEISRVARREVRLEMQGLKKAVSSYRAEIAKISRAAKPIATAAIQSPLSRFSAKGLASQRKQLGLSANDCGLLLGVSGQSIYKWEDGTSRPRAKHLPALVALRSLGRKAAAAHLAALRDAP
jgi:DNA-binding transcriptional regulator YiaG